MTVSLTRRLALAEEHIRVIRGLIEVEGQIVLPPYQPPPVEPPGG